MLTSNAQLGYQLARGGGQAVQGSLSCPPPRISERMDNSQILLHHLLQEYLVERVINLNVQLGYVLPRGGGGGGGASCPGRFICNPRPEFQREWIIRICFFFLHHLLQEYLVEKDINFISVNLRCLLQTFSWVTY